MNKGLNFILVAILHYSIITNGLTLKLLQLIILFVKKEVDDLLAKDTTEPSIGGAGD